MYHISMKEDATFLRCAETIWFRCAMAETTCSLKFLRTVLTCIASPTSYITFLPYCWLLSERKISQAIFVYQLTFIVSHKLKLMIRYLFLHRATSELHNSLTYFRNIASITQ